MKALADYSFIRGVCYYWDAPQEQLERELGYAKRLQINSTRVWLFHNDYLKEPEAYVRRLVNYVRTAWSMGISTMPILWNASSLSPEHLDAGAVPGGESYISHVVNALKEEEGLIMWDIMNEPSYCDYIRTGDDATKAKHRESMWSFLRTYCRFVRQLDPVNAITIGHTYAEDLEPTAADVDAISFHDYLETRARVEATYTAAEEIASRFGKPLINSELACLCRANPYDMALEICEKHGIGWYVFELMVHDYWGDVHGIVYPDGTVRDPSIVAALFGFYRNRDPQTRIRPNPNKEGHVLKALQLAEEALKQNTTVFQNQRPSTDLMLEAAEYCANLLEGCEMIPMIDLPTVAISAWRAKKEEERDIEAIRCIVFDLAQKLKHYCRIL